MKAGINPGAGNPNIQPESITIAIVDDDKALLFLLTTILSKAGYRVLTATNGHDGLRLIQESRPDIILCDVMMPSPDGFELRRILARSPETASIPFIFLTARSAQVDKLHGIEAGADDYITKPFDNQELVARVKAVLRRANLSRQQGLLEAKSQLEKFSGGILETTSEELQKPLMQILASLNLALTQKFIHDPRQQKRLIQIALDNAYLLRNLVDNLANTGELSQEQTAFFQEVVNLASDFYKVIE